MFPAPTVLAPPLLQLWRYRPWKTGPGGAGVINTVVHSRLGPVRSLYLRTGWFERSRFWAVDIVGRKTFPRDKTHTSQPRKRNIHVMSSRLPFSFVPMILDSRDACLGVDGYDINMIG